MAIPMMQFDALESAIKIGRDSRVDSTGLPLPKSVRKPKDNGEAEKADGGKQAREDVPSRTRP